VPTVQNSISLIIIQTSGNSKPPVHWPKAPNMYKSTLLQTNLFDYDQSFSVLHFQQLRILLAFDFFLKSKNLVHITGSGEHGCSGQNFSITAAKGGGGGGACFARPKKCDRSCHFNPDYKYIYIAFSYNYYISIRGTQIFSPPPIHTHSHGSFAPAWLGRSNK
jgi:hypothetical protein